MSHHCVRLTGHENDAGAYSAFSREPHELRVLVTETGRIWQALGEIHYGPDDLRVAWEGIGAYLEYHNHERRHSSPEKLTPAQAYEQNLPVAAPSSLTRTGRVAGTRSEAW